MFYPFVKRSLDIGVSAFALAALSPLLALIAVSIPLDSRGSPFFLQRRVGRGGRLFSMIKFRSMVKDASRLGSWQTAQNDPRITRLGSYLRETSLDELPQMLNVLAGHMSLVGPRPETPAQEALYRPGDWQMRCRVRPGLTGLAQVSGRSQLAPGERLRLDLSYASAPDFAQDMEIISKTFWLVLSRRGAN